VFKKNLTGFSTLIQCEKKCDLCENVCADWNNPKNS